MLLFPCLLCDYTNYEDNNVNTHRLSVAAFDTSAIYDGVLKPNNKAIHAAQNMVNFIASTLAWAVIAPFYQVRDILFKDKGFCPNSHFFSLNITTLENPHNNQK